MKPSFSTKYKYWILTVAIIINLIQAALIWYVPRWYRHSAYRYDDYPFELDLIGVSGSEDLLLIDGQSIQRKHIPIGKKLCAPISRLSEDRVLLGLSEGDCSQAATYILDLKTHATEFVTKGQRAVASPDANSLFFVSRDGAGQPEFKADCLLMRQEIGSDGQSAWPLHGVFCKAATDWTNSLPAATFSGSAIIFADQDGYLTRIDDMGESVTVQKAEARALPLFNYGNVFGHPIRNRNSVSPELLQRFALDNKKIAHTYPISIYDPTYMVHLDRERAVAIFSCPCDCSPFHDCNCLYAQELGKYRQYLIDTELVTGAVQ